MWGLETLKRLNDQAAAKQISKSLEQADALNALRKKSLKQFRRLVRLAKQASRSSN